MNKKSPGFEKATAVAINLVWVGKGGLLGRSPRGVKQQDRLEQDSRIVTHAGTEH